MKKLLSALLCIVMLAGTLSIAAFAQDIRYDDSFTVGDANGDGAVNPLDALTIRKFLATDASESLNAEGADMNCDGSVTALDALALRKVFAEVRTIESYDNPAQLDKLTVSGNDISEYCIVVPAGSTKENNVHFAAEQLKKYIRLACNVDIPICYGSPSTNYSINLVIAEAGSELEAQLGLEGFLYKVEKGDLTIIATMRGHMYAAFDLIEEYLGYRFYSNNYTLLYEARTVDIPDGTVKQHVPELTFRYAVQSFGGSNAEHHFFPRKLNGIQVSAFSGTRHGTLTGPHFINAHSYGYYWRMATGDPYASTYEDKYKNGIQQKESSWNPCFTSDEDYNTLFRGMLETMRMIQGWGHVFRKGTSAMSFSICDNPVVCDCYECRYVSGSGTDAYGRERLESGVAGLNIWLANRAARDIVKYYPERTCGEENYEEYGYMGEPLTDEYPDMKVYTILYGHDKPKNVLPESNLIIMFCGTPCNNHFLESGECEGKLNNLGQSCTKDIDSLKAWGKVCKETGTELWFWYYPVNYNMYLVDSPNILNIYFDFKFIVRECGVTGIYYEGNSGKWGENGFQMLKAHLASLVMWDLDMTYEEFLGHIKEYLWMFYGEGYEYVFEYLMMHEAAGDATGCCYVNNFDRPGDMFDFEYMQENYETMRQLLVNALELAQSYEESYKIQTLLVECDLLGLSANYTSYYVDGNNTDEYVSRYTWMYNFVKDNNIEIYCNDYYTLPETLDVSVMPVNYFYGEGSWNIDNKDTWGYTKPPQDGWGYQPA